MEQMGSGKGKGRLTLRRDGDLGGDNVDATRFKRFAQARERRGDELDFQPGHYGHGGNYVDLEPLKYIQPHKGKGKIPPRTCQPKECPAFAQQLR